MAFLLPKGYRFAGVHCDVKPNTTKLDLSLIVSDYPATAAGVYTQNLVCGAPVQLDRSRTPDSGFRDLVLRDGPQHLRAPDGEGQGGGRGPAEGKALRQADGAAHAQIPVRDQ